MNEQQTGILEKFSNQIDFWLGNLSHTQIVAASYIVSAIVLLCLVGSIVMDSLRQKKKLAALEASGIKRRSTKAENQNG